MALKDTSPNDATTTPKAMTRMLQSVEYCTGRSRKAQVAIRVAIGLAALGGVNTVDNDDYKIFTFSIWMKETVK